MRLASRFLFSFFAVFLLTGAASRKGTMAPDFSLVAIPSGETVTLSKINRDHPVLLTFWATWCPNCVEEVSALKELTRQHASGELKIIGINVQEPQKRVKKFMKKHEINYMILSDESGEVASDYGISGIPASLLLAKGGEILYYGFSLPSNLDSFFEPRRSQ